MKIGVGDRQGERNEWFHVTNSGRELANIFVTLSMIEPFHAHSRRCRRQRPNSTSDIAASASEPRWTSRIIPGAVRIRIFYFKKFHDESDRKGRQSDSRFLISLGWQF